MSGPNRSKSPDLFSMDTDLMGHNSIEHSKKESIISITQHNQMKAQNRCIEDRIESAKKLVKKLNKFCPYYEVTVNGDDAGRVFCKICERHLGAVSSTLKNHINTQEHKQAVEDSISGQNNVNNQSETNNSSGIARANQVAIGRPTGAIVSNTSMNTVRANQLQVPLSAIPTQSPTNNSFDFETFDIQWVPGFQSPNTIDYCMATNGTETQTNATNQLNVGSIPNKTITNL